MDIRKYFQDSLLIILLIGIQHGLCRLDDDYEDGPVVGRCPWIRNKLKNGRVRYRYKGRVAKFLCDSGYELAGKRSTTCVRGQWSNPIPVCVARGCNRVPSIASGRVTEMYRGALLVYDCNPGYTLTGDSSIHCDGRRWNATPPVCGINPDVVQDTHCDFESPHLCGWSHDPTHDFDWRRNQFSTPSGHVGTGPSHDHTFGENKAGYYIYIEASSPRKINDTARLFSPVYPPDESGGCFLFWYHMYGATTGGIRVYFKPESHVFGELSPKWEKFGAQGNQWLRGNMSIPTVNENFQIVIEGIRGDGYVGDSAIDDIELTKSDCQSINDTVETNSEDVDSNSCRGRCRTSNANDSCECKVSCMAAGSCCSDYVTLCSGGNDDLEQNTNESEPGDFYATTTSPLTVTLTAGTPLTVTLTTDVQTSVSSSSPSSQFTNQPLTETPLKTFVPMTSSTAAATTEAISSPSTFSSTVPITDATGSSSIVTTIIPEQQTMINVIPQTSTSATVPNSSPNLGTRILDTALKTNDKGATSSPTNPVKTSSSTKTTVMPSSRSTDKRTTAPNQTFPLQTNLGTNTQLTTTTITPQTTTTTTTQPTTTSTTTQRITTLPTTRRTTTSTTIQPTPTSTTTRQTTTSTTMQPTPTSTTTQTNSTFTAVSTQPRTTSTNTIPSSTTIIPVSTISIRVDSNISNPTSDLVTHAEPTSSSILTTNVPTSVSTIGIPYITTPRYNLRPRKSTTTSTSTETYSTTRYSSTTKKSIFISRTALPLSNTETSTISSTKSIILTSTIKSTVKTSMTSNPIRKLASTRSMSEKNKYSNHMPSPTTTANLSSFRTTSDSYEVVASKADEPNSNKSSVITVCVVVVIAVICIAGGVAFYLRKYRHKRRSNLDDDSELRFLPESDYMEYSDPSNLDKILEY